MTETAAAKAGSAHVLICDDETRLASLAADLLEDHGYQLLTCDAADAALETVLDPEEPIEVLILDVNLVRGMSAEALLTAMSRRQAATRVVLTSGLAREEVPPALLEHPLVAAYLPKPYTIEALVEAVRTASAEATVA
jgi:DNA-binding NtrC family response regulator